MCLAVLAAVLTTTPTLAAGPPRPSAAGSEPDRPSAGPHRGAASVLDGFVTGWLPAGLGSLVSDFTYEWEDITHRSRVWEEGPDDSGAYKVDLTIKVLRGEGLRDLSSLRDYLARYHEMDPVNWALEPFDQHAHRGYRSDDVAFWLEQPGVAIEVKLYDDALSERDLIRTSRAIHPTGH
jgi:hypothetical protein